MTQMTVQQAYDLAVGHLRAGRPADAEGVLRQVVAADANHLPSWLALAQIYYQTARPEQETVPTADRSRSTVGRGERSRRRMVAPAVMSSTPSSTGMMMVLMMVMLLPAALRIYRIRMRFGFPKKAS